MTKAKNSISYEAWMATIQKYDEAKNEVLRLREALELARASVIEECANAANLWGDCTGAEVAECILALKNK